MSKHLDAIVNIAVVIMCVMVGASALRLTLGTNASRGSEHPHKVLRIGDRFPRAATTRLGTSATLVMLLSTHCQFCTNSLPFYTRLTRIPAVDEATHRVVIVSAEPAAVMGRYLDDNDVRFHELHEAPRADPFVMMGTPTLFLLDKTGAVRQIWRGQLDSIEESDVISALSR